MEEHGVIRLATCQFPVGPDIGKNSKHIQEQVVNAKQQEAGIVHFSECALSGYAGVDHHDLGQIDWAKLEQETRAICELADRENVWIVLGSTHLLSRGNLPHNCLYVIDANGQIVDRYDKRFCTEEDLKYYSPGDHFVVFEVNGVKCGLLICYDIRFPELFREYKKLDVKVIFHSFYNARRQERNIHTTIMRPSVQTRAATNGFWISANNSSAHYQSWPSVLVRPDGEFAGSLRFHRPGIMVNRIDISESYYDASEPFREGAMSGTLHSGELVDDPRSEDRRSL